MRYSPDGKHERTLWVRSDGQWLLDEEPRTLRWGTWKSIRIEVSDLLDDEALQTIIDAEVRDAPRVYGLVNFAAWRWWQAGQERR